VERHFALMPDRYLHTTDADEMVRHFRLLQLRAERLLAVEWRSAGHHTILAIATRDHAGLLAQLAGTLTAHGLDILSVDLYTRQDGAVVDVFKVREVGDHGPVDVHRTVVIEAALVAAVEGRYDVAAAVEKRSRSLPRPRRRALAGPTVRFDAVASAACSVVEVRAEDEPGLAYRIASARAAGGLNISFAKIATEKSHALDVFYVTDAAGGKLDAGQEPRIEATVIAALGARPATH
jgi:[protein-PII] uridylyltransferase